jgi:hypothetical protein
VGHQQVEINYRLIPQTIDLSVGVAPTEITAQKLVLPHNRKMPDEL